MVNCFEPAHTESAGRVIREEYSLSNYIQCDIEGVIW